MRRPVRDNHRFVRGFDRPCDCPFAAGPAEKPTIQHRINGSGNSILPTSLRHIKVGS